jgi:diguanylate cyclase (GGDEF)-like protein
VPTLPGATTVAIDAGLTRAASTLGPRAWHSRFQPWKEGGESVPVRARIALSLLLTLSTSAAAESRLPVTVDERLATCLEVEDPEPARAVALADSVLSGPPAPSLAQRAEALGCRGWATASMGQRDDARRDAHSLGRLIEVLADEPDRVRLTRRAGGILHRSGDRVGAVDFYAKALADAEAQGLEAERIPLLINLGVLHSEFEEHERARVNYEQALALMERLEDRRHEAPVRFNLGLNLNGQGRHAEAVPHLQRALDLVRASPLAGSGYEANVAIGLASALRGSGEREAAADLIGAVRGSGLAGQSPALDGQLLSIEAAQLADEGRVEAALAALDRIDPASQTEIQQWSLLRQRADLLERLGRHAEASASLRRAGEQREAYLRHQNHERLAALEAHLRDREQRLAMERLQGEAEQQGLALKRSARRWWLSILGGSLLLFAAGAVLLWQRRMNRRLDRVSRTDPLTGLANRRDMAERLRALSHEPKGGAAVLLIDIDLFKRINDEFGHDAGDAVLVAFASRLQAEAGDEAKVARWGGEEFLVLLPEAGNQPTRDLAERLRQSLAEPIELGERRVRAPVSIGYCNLPLPGAQGADAWHHSLQLADAALYLAKDAGRDGWAGVWIDERLPDWPPERLAREFRLARAQGILNVQSSRPVREALAAVG